MVILFRVDRIDQGPRLAPVAAITQSFSGAGTGCRSRSSTIIRIRCACSDAGRGLWWHLWPRAGLSTGRRAFCSILFVLDCAQHARLRIVPDCTSLSVNVDLIAMQRHLVICHLHYLRQRDTTVLADAISICASAMSPLVSNGIDSGTFASSRRALSYAQSLGKYSRKAIGTGTSFCAKVSETNTWQFACLPSTPQG
jgi:hypothetical protein